MANPSQGKTTPPEVKAKIRQSLQDRIETDGFWTEPRRGAENPSWKGDDLGYGGIHAWLARDGGKRGVCEVCATAGSTEWANINLWGEYRRVRSDYRELCRSCHRLTDSSLRVLRACLHPSPN